MYISCVWMLYGLQAGTLTSSGPTAMMSGDLEVYCDLTWSGVTKSVGHVEQGTAWNAVIRRSRGLFRCDHTLLDRWRFNAVHVHRARVESASGYRLRQRDWIIPPGRVTALGWSLPLGTAFVNVTGSFLLAVFLSLAAGQLQVSQPARLMIATGFFGAYTTFSTYSVESISLLEQGRFGAALVYILGMNVLCLLGAAAGIALVQWLTA